MHRQEARAMSIPQPENWRPVVGYEGLYEVSDLGGVRRLPGTISIRSRRWSGTYTRTLAGGPLRPTKRKKGKHYVALVVNLSRENVVIDALVSHLVLSVFVGPRPEGMEACHADRDPTNNALTNLRWDTHHANVLDAVRHGTVARVCGERSPGAKLTWEAVARGYTVEEVLLCAHGGAHNDTICVVERKREDWL
jgi:hypothetical protein